MTPKKKTTEAVTDVHIAGVDKAVTEGAAEAIEQRSHRTQIILAMIGLMGAITLALQTGFTAYMQSKTREAVESGVTIAKESADNAKAHADVVAIKLKKSGDEHGAKLDRVVVTSEQNHALSNSLMLAMKKSLAETAQLLADISSDPSSVHFKNHEAYVERAKLYEDAYLAHKKTHDEMQNREKQK